MYVTESGVQKENRFKDIECGFRNEDRFQEEYEPINQWFLNSYMQMNVECLKNPDFEPF